MAKQILISLFYLLFSLSCNAQGVRFINEANLHVLLNSAERENKLAMIYCYSDHSVACEAFERTVLTDFDLSQFINSNYVSAKFNIDRGDGVVIAGKYSIYFTPCVLWVNSSGVVKCKIKGSGLFDLKTNMGTISKEILQNNANKDGASAKDSKSNASVFSVSTPPIISIANNILTFKDVNGNNDIDAYEKTSLRFEVKNTGKGTGDNLKVKVSAKGSTGGISFNQSSSIPAIKAGGSYSAEIPITANGNTENGSITFTVLVDEPHGLGSDPVDIEISTKAFVSPLVKVVDHSVTGSSGSNLVRKQPFDLQVLVQNTKPGIAENVSAEIQIPDNILLISGEPKLAIGALKGGATKEILYTLIVTDHYTSGNIPITIKLNESYGKYTENKTITLNLNQALAANKITVQAVTNTNQVMEIKEASLRAEVDKDIPLNGLKNVNTYALIIGNENYSDFQTDLSSEANVDYARNDARIFKEYCEKTLGIPADNITLITDATAGKMRQAVDKMKTLIKNSDGRLQAVFYYAGHGLPDESSHEPYLMPVDVSGKDLSSAIKMSEVYSNLTAYPSKGVTVFLDACFSGGARNQSLIAARSVKIRPKEEALKGRITVFTASSGDQTSWPYKDKQHGMFTYFLLKKLQDSKGDVNYADLGSYLNQQVKFQSVKINSKEQEPQLIHGNDISSDELTKTKLKEGFK